VKEVKKQESEISQESDPNAIPWYEFESLTYIPFDKKLIDRHKLNPQQVAWLESYYSAVVEKLSPMLSEAETAWLKQACSF
jgi:Xaa-Pro aminopeptidase